MKSFSLAALAVASSIGNAVAQSLPSIEAKGSKFFFPNGTQFFIRGIAYQQDSSGNGTLSTNSSYIDPLSIPANCQRDIPYLEQLYTNTIRVYAVNPELDHSECMAMLQDAGIYVIADLGAPIYGQSIDQTNPEWNIDLYARYTSVVDSLQNYTNVIGFFAGNEVSNSTNNTNAVPFVKAAVRDTKAYIKAKGYRSSLGVGYATDDDASIRVNIADFFNCGDQADAVDFWGYNIYSWCGNSNPIASGYAARTAEFSNFSVPAFFAEYGCNLVEPRIFTEVHALFGPNMTDVWSGGIVYQYFQASNNYGLVTVNGDSVTTNQDYANLKTELAANQPTGVNSNDYTPTNSPQACPTEASGVWEAASSPLPPNPDPELCDCMYMSLSCVVSSSTDSNDYADLFNQVFGYMANSGGIPGIVGNGTTGEYGAYSMCNATQQLGWAFNVYYLAQGKKSTACDFGGNATTQSPSTPSVCTGYLDQVGSQGTGSFTNSPTGATYTPAATTSPSKGAAAAGFAASSIFRASDFGAVPIAAITVLAAISGAGMLLL